MLSQKHGAFFVLSATAAGINLPSGGTKNGKPRTVVMTAEVRSLVTALIDGKTANDFVFTHDDGAVR